MMEYKEWKAVTWFSKEMNNQLTANEYKGGWSDCDLTFLSSELDRNLLNMLSFLRQEEYNIVIQKAANVANFAMMIAEISKDFQEAQEHGKGIVH